MNPIQKAELVEIVNSDCQLSARYIDTEGRTCAIGAMCKAKNIPLPDPLNPGRTKSSYSVHHNVWSADASIRVRSLRLDAYTNQ